MDQTSRRVGHYIGVVIGSLIGYVLFVVTSPIMGLFIMLQWIRKSDAENVVFADFKRKKEP